MPRIHRFAVACLALATLVGTPRDTRAQQQAARAPRDFAPGVVTVVPPELDPAETTSRHDLIEIRVQDELDWSPQLSAKSRTLYAQSEEARFTRDLWCLEFGFKPLRMIRLEPGDGGPQRLVWYLVYRVKNTGKAIRATEDETSGEYTPEAVASGPIRFLPHFVLQGHDVAPDGGKIYRAYLDKLIPGAAEAIRQREVPGRRLLTGVEMALEPLAEGEERWGVAMWEDIDPEMDFFSVYVRGLTNAYEWTDPPGALQPGDPPGKGREFARKTLQLNFWRPGDRFMQHEAEVRYGVPVGKASLYGVDEGVAYRWVYR